MIYLPVVHLQARLRRTSVTSSLRQSRQLQYNAQHYDINKAAVVTGLLRSKHKVWARATSKYFALRDTVSISNISKS